MKNLIAMTVLIALTLNTLSNKAFASAFCREVRDQAPVCQR